MSLGTDILAAVKSGGINSPSWQPTCEANQYKKQRAAAKRPALEEALLAMYNAIGNDMLSCQQWADRIGWKRELVRFRAEILMRQKKIRRTTGIQPFLYFKS